MSDQRPEDATPRPDPEPAQERSKPRTYREQREERLRAAQEAGHAEPAPQPDEAGRLDGGSEPRQREPVEEGGPPPPPPGDADRAAARADSSRVLGHEDEEGADAAAAEDAAEDEEGADAAADEADWPGSRERRRRPALDPHTDHELALALRWPLHGLSLALSDAGRVASDIQQRAHLGRLVLALLAVSVLFAVPYGLVLGWDSGWRVAALFVGSLAVCLPSLQVFSHFVGLKLGLLQNAALTLVVAAAGAGFTFGFFPILWFFSETMTDGDLFDLETISVGLLWLSIAAGFLQLLRCLGALRWTWDPGGSGELQHHQFLMAGWLLLLVFVTARMGRALGLMP